MKRFAFFLVLAITASGALALQTALGQTAVPTNAPTIFNSISTYFTGFDSNYNAIAQHGIHVETATVYENGVGVEAEMEADYQFGKANGFLLGATVDNAGIGGTIVDSDLRLGYAINYLDTRFSAGLDGGYRFDLGRAEAGIWGRAEKLATDNTGLYLELEEKPDFGAGTRTPAVPLVKLGVFVKF
jgi:hypothetical protein